MRHQARALSCALVLAASGLANAGIIVEYSSDPTQTPFGAPPGGSFTITGSDVDISLNSGGFWRLRTDNPATESIGRVRFTSPGAWVSVLLIGPSSATGLDPAFAFSSDACLDWNGVDPGNDVLFVQARVGGNIDDDVSARRVVRLDLGGDLAADVTHTSPSDDLSAIVANVFKSDFAITSSGGVIKLVRTTGDLRGDVRNLAGSIELVESIAGDIGDPTGVKPPVVISATDDIRSILAQGTGGSITASITAGDRIAELRTAGAFTGSLTANIIDTLGSVSPVIRTGGDYAADTDVRLGLPPNAQIIIGGSLLYGPTSKLFRLGEPLIGAAGLAGSVLIYANVTGAKIWEQQIEGAWSTAIGREFTIGGVGDEEYNEAPFLLGGGIAGLAPVNLHRPASFPSTGRAAYGVIGPGDDLPVSTVTYGIVTWPDRADGPPVTTKPLRVWASIPELGSSERDVTDCFQLALKDAPQNHTIELTPTIPLQNGYQYRVTPVTTGAGALASDVEGAVGPQTQEFSHQFCIGTRCPWDMNGDTFTNNAELSVVLGQWNQSACMLQGDVNNDGNVDGADLSVVLSKFNTTCGSSLCDVDASVGGSVIVTNPFESNRSTLNPGSSPNVDEPDQIRQEASEAPASGHSADGLSIIGAFGYTSFDAYAAWVSTMTPAEFANHAEVLQGVIAELDAAE